MVKRLLAVLLCVMPLFANAQSVKLGHLDVNSLFLKLPELKDVEAKLKEVQASYETEMKRMEAGNAYNYVLQKYSWDKYNELLETLLNDMYSKCNCKQ